MLHGTCDSGLPVFEICAMIFLGSVSVCEFDHAAESAFLSYHSVVLVRGADLVAPPARSHLCGEYVSGSRLGVECVCDVVCE